jgi:hypothetical protein
MASQHRRRLTSIVVVFSLFLVAISTGFAGHSGENKPHGPPLLQATSFSPSAFLFAKDHGKKPLSGILLGAISGTSASVPRCGASENFHSARRAIDSASARQSNGTRAPPVLLRLT